MRQGLLDLRAGLGDIESMQQKPVWVVGAGLAGSELALQLAAHAISVRLLEMKPLKRTPAQKSDEVAELVCSNSFRGAGLESAVGALKAELRCVGGALIACADETQVPAGGALAVDRDAFSACVRARLDASPWIERVTEELTELPDPSEVPELVIATGPLTSEPLSQAIQAASGDAEKLYFYDAIAPIVDAESIDMERAYFASRYGKGEAGDYLNCPMDQPTYEAFVKALLAAEHVVPRAFEEPRFFEGCLPIEVVAERGEASLRFGCMKPVGLPDPKTGRPPYAVVQLRTENPEKSAYNLVGFQTRMKWGPQAEVLRMIPGLESAVFLRMGSIHRNTYLDSPSLLDAEFRLKARPQLSFAGQITGVEGYVESIASGWLAAQLIAARLKSHPFALPPPTTTLGALYRHTLGLDRSDPKAPHVPSNVHWGQVPSLEVRAKKRDRKRLYGLRAVEDLKAWWENRSF